jgi:hypothetical protein
LSRRLVASSCGRRLAALIVAGFACAWGAAALAQEEGPAATAPEDAGLSEAPPTTMDPSLQERQERNARRREMLTRLRWEYGLDLKLTEAMGRSAFDLSSPTVIAGVQWSYQFKTNTYLGLALSGFPQSQPAANVEPTTNFSGYYAGVRVGQTVFESGKYRAVATVEAGRGAAYFRVRGVDAEAVSEKMTVIEPGAFFIFWTYQGLEIGAAASVRLVQFDDEVELGDHTLKDSDFSAPAFGVTFRTQRH